MCVYLYNLFYDMVWISKIKDKWKWLKNGHEQTMLNVKFCDTFYKQLKPIWKIQFHPEKLFVVFEVSKATVYFV